jgi:DNA-binding beta-propeller fold protein YncE
VVGPAAELEPVFFPAPPEKARLQFLTSFAGEKDLGAGEKKDTRSALERFILGDEDEAKKGIGKPYGVAISDGKIYVCDVRKRMVDVLDLKERKFTYLTRDRRLRNPVNIYIEADGTKYVSDAVAGAVFVFDRSNKLKAIFGKELRIKPVDVVVRGQRCYVADAASKQIVVMNTTTGEEILRMGKEGTKDGELVSPTGIALDEQENVYVTDRLLAKVTKFDRNGFFQATTGQMDDTIFGFVRPKGIAVDKEGRMWVAEAAGEVVKIFNAQGELLMLLGTSGPERGNMILPADVAIDYDNVELFEEYAVDGAEIEFIVLVSNQFGPHLVSVYGFGSFPEQNKAVETGAGQDESNQENLPAQTQDSQ